MTSAPLLLLGTLLLGPPSGEETPAVGPTQPQVGEPAIAPAHVDAERAGPEPMPAMPSEPEPVASEPEPVASEPAPAPSELPSWQETPAPNVPLDQATPIADWTTPVDPAVAAASEQAPPPGMALFAPAIGFFGTMVISQLITGISCDNDVYCGTRGWPWRFMGIATMGFAAGGGWFQGQRIAWDRAQAGKPAKNPVGRRAAGWTMFILGLGGFVADTTLYHLCYDDARGPYTEIVGFRYTCSPVISVVTLDLSTLLGATGLGLALSAEGQLRKQKKLDLSLAPWGGRGQAGLSIGGRF